MRAQNLTAAHLWQEAVAELGLVPDSAPLAVRRQPGLQDATMNVPVGSGLAPVLKLQSPKNAPPAPTARGPWEGGGPRPPGCR